MKEYPIEDGKIVDLTDLKADFMSTPAYIEAHKGLVIPCHDVIIQYEGGALLVMRTDFPAKDILWPIGGRVERGMPIEESLQKKVRKESGLELDELVELGYARTYFRTDPWGHGKGTDTINFMFFAQGKGTFQLDKTVAEPTIVLPDHYTSEFRQSLHPYVQDFMDLAMPLIQKDMPGLTAQQPLDLAALLKSEDKNAAIRFLFEEIMRRDERIYTDDQTKLPPNRKLYDVVLTQEDPQKNIYIIGDIDEFGLHNKKYGHIPTNAAKIAVAGLLRHEVEELNRRQGYPVLDSNREIVSRTNEVFQYTRGDEFAIKLYGMSIPEAMEFAEALRNTVETSFQRETEGITMSFGLAPHTVSGTHGVKKDLEDSLQTADMQLFIAKRNGRNRVGNRCPQ